MFNSKKFYFVPEAKQIVRKKENKENERDVRLMEKGILYFPGKVLDYLKISTDLVFVKFYVDSGRKAIAFKILNDVSLEDKSIRPIKIRKVFSKIDSSRYSRSMMLSIKSLLNKYGWTAVGKVKISTYKDTDENMNVGEVHYFEIDKVGKEE